RADLHALERAATLAVLYRTFDRADTARLGECRRCGQRTACQHERCSGDCPAPTDVTAHGSLRDELASVWALAKAIWLDGISGERCLSSRRRIQRNPTSHRPSARSCH